MGKVTLNAPKGFVKRKLRKVASTKTLLSVPSKSRSGRKPIGKSDSLERRNDRSMEDDKFDKFPNNTGDDFKKNEAFNVSGSQSSDDDEDCLTSDRMDRSLQRVHRHMKDERLRRTLFVGNLPLNTTRKDLRRLFSRVLKDDAEAAESGCRVESVRIRGFLPASGGTGKLARKRAVIQGELPAGVSRTLIAYVVLTSSVGIRPALALNGHWLSPKPATLGVDAAKEDGEGGSQFLKGRHIRVDSAARTDMFNDTNHCVFLGNLPFNVTEDEVRDVLSNFGEVSDVRLIRDRETGAVKGFGYVHFTDPTSVSLAIRSSETVSIHNRPIRIQEWRNPLNKKKKLRRKVGNTLETNAKRPKESISGKDTKLRASKLKNMGRVKGITLPSNARGTQRERQLQKRLLKKRKRQLRREQLAAKSKKAT